MNTNSRKTLSLDELIEIDRSKTEAIKEENDDNNTESIQDVKKANKYYLPILSMDESDAWPSKPKSERNPLTADAAINACLNNCCGQKGVFSGCCRLDPDDLEHILGPVSERWIKRFLKFAKKNKQGLKRSDLVIDFEEGKIIGNTFFNGNEVFNKLTSYPMLRFQVHGPRFSCKFLNVNSGACTIYEQRPDMCKNYYCEYLKSNFLIKTSTNGKYEMIDDRRWQCRICGERNKNSSKVCKKCNNSKLEE